jgi:predicted glutamine amidotransferase
MCGLVGMAGFLEHKHKDVMKELLFLDSLRGKDSTGLTAINRDRQCLTRKFTVPGYEFIEYPVVEKAMTFADQLWIGHNRFRTFGAVSKANAHPFEVLDENDNVMLVGAHNGSLDNKFEIESRLKGERFDTDSEAMFNWFATAGNYREAISLLRGAWSLVWWDATTDSLHFCRNDQRPMFFAYTKEHKAIIWASEAWMIINSCRRNGLELEQNDKGLSCYSTLPDYLYTIEIPQERNTPLPELKREGGYTGAPQRGRFGYVGDQFKNWWDAGFDDEKSAKEAAEKAKKTTTVGAEGNVVTLGLPPVKGYKGADLSRKELAALMDKGCGWCGDPFQPDDRYGFIEEKVIACHKCIYGMHRDDGDRVRSNSFDPNSELDDDLPFNLQYGEDDERPEGQFEQKDTPEYRNLIEAAAIGSAKKAVG